MSPSKSWIDGTAEIPEFVVQALTSKDQEFLQHQTRGGKISSKLQHLMTTHWIAVAQALFVVFLWATSWVLVKFGLQNIPPITFAGLRYFLAFLCLLVALLVRKSKSEIQTIKSRNWGQLAILGIFFYAITQGAIFVALAYLPAVTVNLLWSFSSVLIALLGSFWLSERPTWLQWTGIVLAVSGAILYFYPVSINGSQWIGIVVAILGIFANAISAIMGRSINRTGQLNPLTVTVISMGVGSIALLIAGVLAEKAPTITFQNSLMILWLALVNTAFAFTLWNHTLRTLTAMESSIINGTILVWITIFAVTILGESINFKEIIGLVIVSAGTLIVQLKTLPGAKNS